jgi:hypothetical protein
MINHEPEGGSGMAGFGGLIGPKIGHEQGLDDRYLIPQWWNHERYPRHLQHLPRDY